MKKSEFIEKRLEYWKAFYRAGGGITPPETHMRRDLEAAEAAGVAWEPEEDALVFDENHRIIRGDRPGRGWFICGPVLVKNPEHPGREWQEAHMRELARRHRAWPELERLAHASPPAINLCQLQLRLREILGSGKP